MLEGEFKLRQRRDIPVKVGKQLPSTLRETINRKARSEGIGWGMGKMV